MAPVHWHSDVDGSARGFPYHDGEMVRLRLDVPTLMDITILDASKSVQTTISLEGISHFRFNNISESETVGDIYIWRLGAPGSLDDGALRSGWSTLFGASSVEPWLKSRAFEIASAYSDHSLFYLDHVCDGSITAICRSIRVDATPLG